MKILIEMAGGLGDELCTIPSLRELKKIYPESKITCKYRFRELFLGLDFIDELTRCDRPIDRKQFDKIKIMKWATGNLSYLASNHLIDVFSLQLQLTPENRKINIKIFDDEINKYSFLNDYKGKRPIICFDIFASAQANRWSRKRFATLMEMLKEKHNALIFQIGGKNSEFLNIGNYALELPLRDMAALMSYADLYIGNNSGAAHLSSSLDIPSVKIFSATVPDYYIHNIEKEKIVYSELDCRGCVNNKPGNNPLASKFIKCPQTQWLCKDVISVSDVYKACEEQLNTFFYKGDKNV